MAVETWWVDLEDSRQASDLEITQELRPEGVTVTYALGILAYGSRRQRSRLLIRCYDDGQITLAWGLRCRGGDC